MTYSTLYARVLPPEAPAPDLNVPATGPKEPFKVVVGTLPSGATLCHGAPGEPIPEDATTVYADGTRPWNWVTLATEQADVAQYATPHEYAGEPTAQGIDAEEAPVFAQVALRQAVVTQPGTLKTITGYLKGLL